MPSMALHCAVVLLLVSPLLAASFEKLGDDPPSEVDWRKKGVVPEVSDQGRLGKSAAFAVTHSVDSYWAINHGELIYGSVTEVADCCTRNEVVSVDEIFDCIVRIDGIATSESYPKNVSGKCLSEAYKPSIMINGHRDVDHFDEKALAMVVARTPVVVLVDASRPSFQEYSSGVYSDDKCTRTELDHTLLVVGYGTMDGKDYWICQNTWGTSWGMDGYMLMARNANNMCGIATKAAYPI